jgi:hypothetical protein
VEAADTRGLSLVILYNGAICAPAWRRCARCSTRPATSEIVFVDDGNRDETGRSPGDLRDHPRRFIFHERNATRQCQEVRGDDRRVWFSYRSRGRAYAAAGRADERHEIDVATSYRTICARRTRWFASSCPGLPEAARPGRGLGIQDETGCKFFRRDTCAGIVLGSQDDGWFWDTEVMARAVLADLRIREMPVLFLRRWDKQSTVRLVHDIRSYLAALHRFRIQVGLSLLNKSPIYWGARGYDLVMRSLYGASLERAYAEVAGRIPDGASVVDLCCGTSRLDRDHLRARGCRVLGLDFNGHFVMQESAETTTRFFDVRTDPIPEADCVMLSSLYHFRSGAGSCSRA